MTVHQTNRMTQLLYNCDEQHVRETGRPFSKAIYTFKDGVFDFYVPVYDWGGEQTPRMDDIWAMQLYMLSKGGDNIPYEGALRPDCSVDWRKVMILAKVDESIMDKYEEWEAFQMNMDNGLGVHPDDQVKYKGEKQ